MLEDIARQGDCNTQHELIRRLDVALLQQRGALTRHFVRFARDAEWPGIRLQEGG